MTIADVDTSAGDCGNILAAVGGFAIENNLVAAEAGAAALKRECLANLQFVFNVFQGSWICLVALDFPWRSWKVCPNSPVPRCDFQSQVPRIPHFLGLLRRFKTS